MYRFAAIFLILLMSCEKPDTTSDVWEPAQAPIMTRWAKDVDPGAPWPEYPRPQLQRYQWVNLNGLWDFAITDTSAFRPENWGEMILVPFPLESALSGVRKRLGTDEVAYYRKTISIPEDWTEQVVLHIEASDWRTEIWVNDEFVGENQGGYRSFSPDITKFIEEGKAEIVLRVADPTDKSWQPLGKQVTEPGGIFYTPVSGPWQTIWMEHVHASHIQNVKIHTDIDRGIVSFDVSATSPSDLIEVVTVVEGKEYRASNSERSANKVIEVALEDFQLWSPENPVLYHVNIYQSNETNTFDSVSTYFGMRKIDLGKDENGFTRIRLNNEAVFMNGPLDQGYWPDGIYTPPTEEAMLYDLVKIKEMGFNMVRKHVKIESKRWYYLADSLGLLVWQDMPNGDKKIAPNEPDINRSEESDKNFRSELLSMILQHYNHPSIIVWVPFNEGWGQYNTSEIVDFIKELDSTRLVINTSGWADRGVGDIHDIHNYPDPRTPEPEEERAIVLGEFGGLGYPVEGHLWEEENWGYQNFNSVEELTSRYEGMYEVVFGFIEKTGLSASVYTQITDVETETNGLMTYDREVVKIDPGLLKKINTNNFIPAPGIDPAGGLFNKGDEVTLSSGIGIVRYTLDGSEPSGSSPEYIEPIKLDNSTTIKARTFTENDASRVVSYDFERTDIRKPTYLTKYAPRYPADGDFALVDGKMGSDKFNDGNWQGFDQVPMQVLFNSGEVLEGGSIELNFLEDTRRWIFLPASVKLELSNDGENFEEVFKNSIEQPSEHRDATILNLSIPVGREWTYVRVTAEPSLMPEWHDGKGRKSWIFVDEVSWE